jgi:microcystin-dependent protein
VSDQFVGEIRVFALNFAPSGWAFCDGQLLAISQNAALFSLLGTNFGGNGTSTFGLPNLQGSVPLNWGQGPGLSSYELGEVGGEPTVTLVASTVPAHTHPLLASPHPANLNFPGPQNALARSSPAEIYTLPGGTPPPPLQPLAAGALGTVGGSQPHNNLMPYLTLNFCIALTGIFPARN